MQTRKHAIPVWMRNEEKIKQQKAEFVTLYAKKSAFFKHKINLSLRQTAKLSSFCEIKKKNHSLFYRKHHLMRKWIIIRAKHFLLDKMNARQRMMKISGDVADKKNIKLYFTAFCHL
jgi:hypothetical protein